MKKSVVVFSVALLFSLSVYSQEAVVESEKSSASENVSAEVTSVAEDFSGEIVSDGTADEISKSLGSRTVMTGSVSRSRARSS